MIPFLKVAVVFMGILIVAGVVVLAIMMYGKLSGNSSQEKSSSLEIISPPIEPQNLRELALIDSLDFPIGSVVESMVSSEDRLVLLIKLPEESQKLVFIDLQTTKILKQLSINKSY